MFHILPPQWGFFWQRRGGGPAAAEKWVWMCQGARQGLEKGMSWPTGLEFLLEFPFQGQLVPFGAGSDHGDAERGQVKLLEQEQTVTS